MAEEIADIMKSLKPVKVVKEADFTAIITPFTYPDGDLITVYIQGNTVSDFGEAYSYCDPEKFDRLFSDISSLLKIRVEGSVLKADLKDLPDLIEACILISWAESWCSKGGAQW